MNDFQKHLLREYKKSNMIIVKRFATGMYDVTINGKEFSIEACTPGEGGCAGEWIVRVGHVMNFRVEEDNYCGHYNSLLEAQYELVQNES